MQTKARGMSINTRKTLTGLAFILPNFIGFLVFIMIPVLFSLVLAFSKWDGFTAIEFAGIRNFTKIFASSVFRRSLGLTLRFTVYSVAFTTAISLALALLLNREIKGRNFFRSAIFFPYVASVVAIGVVWNNMFQPSYGPINTFLQWLGVEKPPMWFASSQWALPAVIIVSVWKSMGYYMVIYLAGLQGINPELFEAAKIDGASGWRLFRSITFPMLAPSTFFVVIMLTINSFKTFDLIFVLTEGGPGTATTVLSKYIYDQSFISWNYGTASAASMILFLIVGAITVFQFKAEKKWVNY